MKKIKQVKMESTRSFSELVLELVASADEVVSLAKDSEIDTEVLSEFAIYIEKLSPILDTLREDKIIMDTPSIRSAIGSLEAELQRARNCIVNRNSCSNDHRFDVIQQLTHDLGRSLGLLLFATIGVSLDLKDKLGILHKELMNAKFDHSYCCSSSESTREIVEEIMNEEQIYREKEEIMIIEREDVALQLKYGNDDEFKNSLLGLEIMIRDKIVDCEWITDEGIIPILFNRMGSSKCIDRLSIIKVLRSIAHENPRTKEKMADINSLTTLVKSLARDEMERREAVGLLMDLSQLSSVRRRVGRIQGCIIMLVAILNGSDPISSNDAGKLLAGLSCNTQNALLMAEAGYFHPLIQHLKEGSEMSKILMATALSRMVLTEKSRASLGEDGAIQPLIIMFKTGKLEAKLSALNALQNLSLTTKNISYIVDSGVLPPLLQLLFSVTSSLMSLREPASAILATISCSDSVLEHRDLPDQLLSLVNLSSPKIKCNILLALNNILSQPGAAEVTSKTTQNGAMQLLIPLINETDTKIRVAALDLLFTISNNVSIEESYLPNIVNIISSSSSEAEKAAAIGLLSNIPLSDKKATDILKGMNLLPMLVSLIGSLRSSSSTTTAQCLEESIASVFIRFTLPSDKKLQVYAAEMGVIPILIKILSHGSIKAKSRAATSLTQLSQNTLSSKRVRNLRWGYCVPTPTADGFCEIHSGYCSVKGNFCLVKAGAIPLLIRILEGDEREADETVLKTIATLLQDEIWEDGSNFIAKISSGVEAVIRVLEVGSVKAKETALWILDRVLRIEEFRSKYGGSTQVLLIDLAHKGEPSLRPLVANILMQLELLQDQSSYF
ncbi:U-box domain-containing protein 43-like [Chenopodium quinoa]|uniref:U-box domain-containing protein 43-like n=1 Tax=Chenopodium quinoa TaxID=63459 RepID=UPI000B788D5F|nr:U-box domain-containing protein 43-like [Chenopodium quinoa]